MNRKILCIIQLLVVLGSFILALDKLINVFSTNNKK